MWTRKSILKRLRSMFAQHMHQPGLDSAPIHETTVPGSVKNRLVVFCGATIVIYCNSFLPRIDVVVIVITSARKLLTNRSYGVSYHLCSG